MSQAGSESLAISRTGERRQAGELIGGRYTLIRRLGMGGMGVVWVARSEGLGVDVALKLLHDASADPISVERMAREARAAALLGHSAIVRVLDFGRTEDGQPFMAMELLQGEDLLRLLKREGRRSAVEAVTLLLPIVDALVVAHKHGIVHRDLKPENLFVARDSLGRIEPKILDFGIAKLESVEDKRLTQMGTLLGSPAYLSPEQAEGIEEVDHRVDIWSMGVVLYELVTGELPFDGKTCNAVLRSVARDRPRAITEFAAGNDALWAIVKKCLRKEPTDRWGSMQELGEALARWATDQGAEVDISSRSLRDAWLSSGSTNRKMRLVPGRTTGSEELRGDESRTTQTVDSQRVAVRATLVRARLVRRFKPLVVIVGVAFALFAAAVVAWRALHASSIPTADAPGGTPRASPLPGSMPEPIRTTETSGQAVQPDEAPVRGPAPQEVPSSARTAPRAADPNRKAPPKHAKAAPKTSRDSEFGF